jgi:GNAT superfamily N-acetyltransferase
MDEINYFDTKNDPVSEGCDYQGFLAYLDGKLAGRIAGIIQPLYNIKTGEKNARFSRFDSIDDERVARALFEAVVNWAKEKGMDTIHGPLGFNDTDREGIMIWGFDQMGTYVEQYNHDYYPHLVEASGFEKEFDWIEYKIFQAESSMEKVDRVAQLVMKRYKLKKLEIKNKNKFFDKYADQLFDIIDEAYEDLRGTVPLSIKLRRSLISQFKMFLRLDFFIAVADENDRIVGFGFAFPSYSTALNKSKGRLLPLGIFRLLYATWRPRVADLGLIGVRNEYLDKGVSAFMLKFLIDQMKRFNVDYCETNLLLEDNYRIQNFLKHMKKEYHKRRRCYIKHLV